VVQSLSIITVSDIEFIQSTHRPFSTRIFFDLHPSRKIGILYFQTYTVVQSDTHYNQLLSLTVTFMNLDSDLLTANTTTTTTTMNDNIIIGNDGEIGDQSMFLSTNIANSDGHLFDFNAEELPMATECFNANNPSQGMERNESSLALHSLLDKFFNEAEEEQQQEQQHQLGAPLEEETSMTSIAFQQNTFERAITPDLVTPDREELFIPQLIVKPAGSISPKKSSPPSVVTPRPSKATLKNEEIIAPLNCMSSPSLTKTSASPTSASISARKPKKAASSKKSVAKFVAFRLRSFKKSMHATQRTSKKLQAWDKRMGLKKCHSKTMLMSCKSRKEALVAAKEDLALQRKSQSENEAEL